MEGENRLNSLVCDDLVLAVDGVKYADEGMSTRSYHFIEKDKLNLASPGF